MEARCKNCKHWEKVVADPDPEFQTEPELLATRRGYGLCLKIADGTQLLHKEEKADSVLDATTAYTLGAEALTLKEFPRDETSCGRSAAHSGNQHEVRR
jgi:hypothetical protein